MRRWLPLAVGSGLLLAGCTESRGPTQPAVRGAPTFDSEHGQGPRTHVMVPRGQSRGRHGGQGSGNTGIFYHGGPIIYNQNVAAIYWSAAPIYNGGPAPGTTGPGSADGSLVGFYMSNLGGSPYFNINTTYFDGSNTHINNVVNYTQYWASNTNLPPTDYSPLSDDAIIAQIEAGFSSGALTFDPSTLYIVFTGIGVNPGGGFGTVYCAYHGFYIAADGRNVKYSAMPYAVDPAYPGACSALSGSPNDDIAADAEVNLISHETEETTTDENLDAWFDASGAENADKCAWQFGQTYTTGNGSTANISVGGRDWLVQMNWVNATVSKKGGPVGCKQGWP